MKTLELLSEVRALNIRLWVEDGRLRFQAPPGSLTPDLKGRLKDHRQAILEFLTKLSAETTAPFPKLGADARPDLSFAQQRMWFLHKWSSDGVAYHLPLVLTLLGRPDISALQQGLQTVVNRHQSLRLNVMEKDGTPFAQIQDPLPFPLRIMDAASLVSSTKSDYLKDLVSREIARPFDLTQAPMLRAGLFSETAERHILIFTFHHIISDGWSLGVFIHELTQTYAALLERRVPQIPMLQRQYGDFAAWQRQRLSGESRQQKLAFWRDHLAGAPQQHHLPTDRSRPKHPSGRGARFHLHLQPELTQSLKDLAQDKRASLFMVLHGAFAVWLKRLSGEDDLVVGTPVANRTHPYLEPLIGLFVNTLPLRTRLHGNPTFEDFLQQVRQTDSQAFGVQDLPFEQLVEALQPERVSGRNALFQIMLILQNTPLDAPSPPALEMQRYELEWTGTQVDLTLSLMETEVGLQGFWEYSLDLFDRSTIMGFSESFQVLLAALPNRPQTSIETLPLLSPEAREQILIGWNQTQWEPVFGGLIHHRIQSRGALYPDAVALKFGAMQLSYGEMDARAEILAAKLRTMGITRESIVGICIERSLELVLGLLGVLNSGAALLPLDPDFPAGRLAFMLQEASLLLLAPGLTKPELPTREQLPVLVLDLNVFQSASAPAERSADHGKLFPENVIYTMYTSGSTGRPKGAVNTHGAVANRLDWMQHQFPLDGKDVVLQKTPFSFDVSGWELYWPLLIGAKMVLAEPGGHKDPAYLAGLINRNFVTTLHFVPSMLRAFLEEPGAGDCRNLRRIFCSGEALPPRLRDRCLAMLPSALYNLYGPTEAAIDVSFHSCRADADPRTVPIGTPIHNTRLHILDARLEPVPVGVTGQLMIGGTALGRGYLLRPDLTADRFIADPFQHGQRLYQTGDLAYYRADGAIVFVGRKDLQVKLRGFRIELGEIEAVLKQHPHVREAVLQMIDEGGEPFLAAYLLTAEAGPDSLKNIGDYRRFLKRRLPDFMVPDRFVFLESLPLTPSGKLDRRALPKLELGPSSRSGPDFVPPEGATESLLAQIWSQVLNLEKVSALSDFFKLGGHSLLAARVMSRIRTAFEVELPLHALFEAPVLRDFAKIIQNGGTIDLEDLKPVNRHAEPQLSFSQKRLWFLDQLEGPSATYNMPFYLKLTGRPAVDPLERAVRTIAGRHQPLHSAFLEQGGEPRLKLLKPGAVPFKIVDLSRLPEPQACLKSLRVGDGELPFDLSRGPMLRVTLVKLTGVVWEFWVTTHHIVFDGWSGAVFMDELAQLYRTFLLEQATSLPELPLQYSDFAHWQRQWLAGERMRAQIQFWKEVLDGAPSLLELPTDVPRPRFQSFRGAMLPFRLAPEINQGLHRCAGEAQATLFMAVMAGFKILLSRYSGQKRIVVGAPIAYRNRTEFEPLIGFFLNNLALHSDLSGQPGFHQFLVRERRSTLQAYAHQDVPFDTLVAELQPERSLNHSPIFQVMLVFQNAPMKRVDFPGFELAFRERDTNPARFDMTLTLLENLEGGLEGLFEYNADLFFEKKMVSFLEHLIQLISHAVKQPDTPIHLLPLLTKEERRRQYHDWNQTTREFPSEKHVYQLIDEKVHFGPDRTALVFEDTYVTYEEMNRRANRLAHRLREIGVKRESLVAILGQRDSDFWTAMLAVLKAGGIYLPLNPLQPPHLLAQVLCQSRPVILLSEMSFRKTLRETLAAVDEAPPLFDYHALFEKPGETTSPPVYGLPGSGAYVLFTSGSTGVPKGAMVEYRGMLNHIFAKLGDLGMTAEDILAQNGPQSFDVSVWQFLGPLLLGGMVQIFNQDESRDPVLLLQRLVRHRITVLEMVPSQLRMLVELLQERVAQPQSKPPALPFLRWMVPTGEVLPPKLCRQWFALYPQIPLMNTYGHTECSDDEGHYRFFEAPSEQATHVPIGKPIQNAHIYILDPYQNLLPVGVAGEVYIGGVAVGRGYLYRPARTAAAFVPDPYSGLSGARLYKTGDLARYLTDGNMAFISRVDFQIKIRGFRIELGEIEATLAKHPQSRDQVVTAHETAQGHTHLVAYVANRRLFDGEEQPLTAEIEAFKTSLRQFLSQRLADYAVPAFIECLPALPLTPNGKVNRSALPKPKIALVETDTGHLPRTMDEEIVAGIWEAVLGLAHVGLDDNFFELGGHSLLATQVLARVRQHLEVEIPLRHLFENPTVAALAAAVRNDRRGGAAQVMPPIQAGAAAVNPELSHGQKRLWFLDKLDGANAAYNLPAALGLRGLMHVAAMEEGFQRVIQRHESLRTTFPEAAGRALQFIQTEPSASLALVDLSALNRAACSQVTEHLLEQNSIQPFDLANGPLFRKVLVKTETDHHILLIAMHHIIADGWSVGVLVDELMRFYRMSATGRGTVPVTLNVQYRDFALWQRQWLSGPLLQRQLDYWRHQLDGAPRLHGLPIDKPRPQTQTFKGAGVSFQITPSCVDGLRLLGRKAGTTLFMTLHGAFNTLLWHYSGQNDWVVGTPVANRIQKALEPLIGFFVNALVLRTDLSGRPGFLELLQRVKQTALDAYAHQDVPFEQVVEALKPERDLSHTPLFQVMLVVQNAPQDHRLRLPGLKASYLPMERKTAAFDLLLFLYEGTQGLESYFEYNTDLFERTTIARLARHFSSLLKKIIARPEARISQYNLLDADELRTQLISWNQTDAAVPYGAVQRAFEKQADRHPDALALISKTDYCSYGTLNLLADGIADRLRRVGVGPDVIVGICLPRSREMVVAILAVLKAGGAYVPLDPNLPLNRIRLILEETVAPITLVNPASASVFADVSQPVMVLEERDFHHSAQTQTSSVRTPRPKDEEHSGFDRLQLAYVIYTSGSSGRPKGVLVHHHALANQLYWRQQTFVLDEQDRVLQTISPSFDPSVWQIFWPLTQGAQLALPADETTTDAAALARMILTLQVSVTATVPSFLRVLIEEPAFRSCRRLKHISCGGEPLPLDLQLRFARVLEKTEVLHVVYGPTEATIDASSQPCPAKDSRKEIIHIGRPITNARLYILTPWLTPVPAGVVAELFIAGDGLSRGYLNRPRLQAAAFIPNPFVDETQAGNRLYRTGDLVRYLPNGSLAFIGRADQQVKIRGFRIELGEIQTRLNAYPQIKEALVLVHEPSTNSRMLVAFAVVHASELLHGDMNSADQIRSDLRQHLPEYMVPQVLLLLPTFPYMANGKIDRRALLQMVLDQQRDIQGFAPPHTPTQLVLAEIWCSLLNVERVGLYDNFFDLGGDSILSIQIVAKARQAGLALTPKILFNHQTVAELAEVAEALPAREMVAEQGQVSGSFPLTPIQTWFFNLKLLQPHYFNQAVLLEPQTPLVPKLLEQTLREIARHHDLLRLQLMAENTGGRNLVPHIRARLFDTGLLEIMDLDETVGNRAQILERALAQVQAGLNLEQGPLWRTLLMRFSSGKDNQVEERLLIVAHHLLVDGVSWRILLEDLQTVYLNLLEGRPAGLPAKTTSFKAWAERLSQTARNRDFSEARAYWRPERVLEIAPFPMDYPTALGENTVALERFVSRNLDSEQTRLLLQELPNRFKTRINEVLLYGLAMAYRDWTGQSRLTLNLEGHGRESLFEDFDLSRTLGWFTASFPVMLQVDGDPMRALKAVKQQLRSVPGQGLDFGMLRYLAGDDRATADLIQWDQVQIAFNYLGQLDQNNTQRRLFKPAEESSGQAFSPANRRPFLLEINAYVINGELCFHFSYGARVHRQKTMEALADGLIRHLCDLLERRDQPVSAFVPDDFPLIHLDGQTLDQILDGSAFWHDLYPLSPMQEGMLSHSIHDADAGVYFQQVSCILEGDLQPEAFQKAWNYVLERHTLLRTSFVWRGLERPLQRVHDRAELPWQILDWSALNRDRQQHRLEAFLVLERRRGFVLDQAPLMRCALFRMNDKQHYFVWNHHHLLMDGWSLPLVLGEVLAFYETYRVGRVPQVRKAPLYRDYIQWLSRQDLGEAETYWRDYLQGFAHAGALPAPLEGDLGRDGDFDEISARLSPQVSQKLRSLTKHYRATLNIWLQGAWALLLHRYSMEEDVVFGATVAGRPGEVPGISEIVGLFINTLPVRVSYNGYSHLPDWLDHLQTRQMFQESFSFTPLLRINEWSELRPGQPLFNTIFIHENYPVSQRTGSHRGTIRITDVNTLERSHYPLSVTVVPDEEIWIRFTFDLGFYDHGAATRLLENYQALIEDMVENPESPLGRISAVGPREKNRLLEIWNHPPGEFPADSPLTCLFEQIVRRFPDAVAVADSEGRVQCSYDTLNQQAHGRALRLLATGVQSGDRVALAGPRSLEWLVSLLAVLKIGGVYVPLEPDLPRQRLETILEDAAVSLLMSPQKPDVEPIPWLALTAEAAPMLIEDRPLPERPRWGVSLAYIIYTSGSTGKPKGVAVSHTNVARLVCNTAYVPIQREDHFCFASNPAFDAATFEIWGTFVHGARLTVVPKDLVLAPGRFAVFLATYRLTTLFLTTALFQRIVVEVPDAFKGLKHLLFGGEAVDPQPVRLALEQGPERLLHVYGPTESTTFASWHQVNFVPMGAATVPIGLPLTNTTLHVMDARLRLLPCGGPGELCIGGEGLAQRYLNRPALTAAKFVPDPFGEAGSRLYRSGDLVRRNRNGAVEFIGRIDHQVKMRGFRIELGEIEGRLKQHPRVGLAVVLLREDQPGEKRLVAYVQIRLDEAGSRLESWSGNATDSATARAGDLTPIELRTFLADAVPEHMVPHNFVIMEALPLNANGKVDRKALPEPEPFDLAFEQEFIPAKTPIEWELSAMWSDVLKLKRVGIGDNFFELGGHSLTAMQVISRIREVFGVELSLREFFESGTIAQLVQRLDTGPQGVQRFDQSAIPKADRNLPLPLSYGQRRLWFLHHQEGVQPLYNIWTGFYLCGVMDPLSLEQAVSAMVARHEVLRTTYPELQGQPTQVIGENFETAIALVDLRHLPEGPLNRRVLQLLNQAIASQFDLDLGPLFRLLLVQLETGKWLFAMVVHHMIADGWSLGVMTGELVAFYRHQLFDQELQLQHLPIQYADYCAWEHQRLQDGLFDQQLAYWRKKLGGDLPVLELPGDRPRPSIPSFRGSKLEFTLPNALLDQLKQFSQARKMTLFTTLLSAYGLLLFRYGNQTDMAIGSSLATRQRRELEPLIGFFINNLAFRIDLKDNPSFDTLLQQVKQTILEAQSHRDIPLEKLIEELDLGRDRSRNPLFQTLFVLQNTEEVLFNMPGLDLLPVEVETRHAHFDLAMSLVEDHAGLIGSLDFQTDLFDRRRMKALAGHFENLLRSVIDAPQQRLSECSMLSEAEREQLLYTWNESERAYDREGGIVVRFDAVAAGCPDRIAVVFGSQCLAYGALGRLAEDLAYRLQALGLQRGEPVALLQSSSVLWLVSLLGVLKAGGAYLPMDPELPRDRLSGLMVDSGASILLTEKAASLPDLADAVSVFELGPHSLRQLSQIQEMPGPADRCAFPMLSPGDLAYVIYTSGSTGLPKGTGLCHGNVLNLVSLSPFSDLMPHDRVAQTINVSFDVTTAEIWSALLHGATLVGLTKKVLIDPDQLAETIRAQYLHTLFTVTAIFNAVVKERPDAFQPLTKMVFGGEAADPSMVRLALEQGMGVQWYNAYGPTETTAISSLFPLHRLPAEAVRVSIGKPIADGLHYVLDPFLNPLPVGVPGELCIGGGGLARGYWNRPELTASRFVPNPYGSQPGGRLYRTGDRVQYLSNGEIDFLDRLDDQIKIRGFRVELGEVEHVLLAQKTVDQAAVLARQGSDGHARLMAYVVPSRHQEAQGDWESSLRAAMARQLPDYMVPSTFMVLAEMPLTASGKIDRRALPELLAAVTVATHSQMKPRDPCELRLTQIWEKVLEVRPIGIQDSFFELGGHSFLAIQLVSEINREFGLELASFDIFQDPTIEKLAERLRDRSVVEKTPLVPLQTEGEAAPLYCIHPGGGAILCYLDLARALGDAQPFYALQSPILYQGEPLLTIEAMAAFYLEHIRRHQTRGPYHLAGWSLGGLIAYEMARQLLAEGVEVGFLGLIDAATPGEGNRTVTDLELMIYLLREWSAVAGKDPGIRFEDLAPLNQDGRLALILQKTKQQAMLSPLADSKTIARIWEIFKVHNQAVKDYQIRPYPKAIHFFAPMEHIGSTKADPIPAWRALAEGGLIVHHTPGHHDAMVLDPHAEVLAEKLKGCLEQSSAESLVSPRDLRENS